MSSTEASRFHVQSLLARGLGLAGASDVIGVAGASEIWGGVEPREKPGWYVWLHRRPGAYALDLEDAESTRLAGAPLVRAALSVRHYPSPGDPRFAAFSPEERALVNGGWLDATGAPEISRAASIPAGLFVIGALEVLFDEAGTTRAVTVGALDRMRDVPAWELALPLFTAVGGIVAQVERRSATRLVETTDVEHRTALLVFDPEGSCRDGVLPFLDPEARVTRDVVLHPTTAALAADPRTALEISPSWFAPGAPLPARVGCCS